MTFRDVWRHYKCLEIIQHGSFATLYKAMPRKGEGGGAVPVAIKIATDKDEKEERNNPLEKEAEFLRTLVHPHTVPLVETVESPRGTLALVLEYCPTDLFSLLGPSEKPLPVRAYLAQILTAVAFFHARDIVHCDLKPENILINPKGVLKICDFGFAENTGSPPRFKGTLEYLSPEYVWDDTLPHSPSTDMWSIGCIFYMLLTQQALPFASLAKTDLLSDYSDKIRYSLESVLVFLDPFPVQPSGIKPYPSDLQTRPRRFKFFPKRQRSSWKTGLVIRGVSPHAIDLLSQFWELCPGRRVDAQTALTHPFFSS